MPELPEVETVKNGLGLINGKTIQSVFLSDKKLRFAAQTDIKEKLVGCVFSHHERRAKYIISHFSNNNIKLLWHLGMSGQIIINGDTNLKHNHFIVQFTDGTNVIYNDARRFGTIDYFTDNHFLLAKLGREPFGLNADICAQYYNKKAPIKSLLLNQDNIVGIGNIYASEILWLAGIHPNKAGNSLNQAQFATLAGAIEQVLNNAIIKGGSSFSNFVHTDGEMGYFQNEWQAYQRENTLCAQCNGIIERFVMAGRATYFCPVHQQHQK